MVSDMAWAFSTLIVAAVMVAGTVTFDWLMDRRRDRKLQRELAKWRLPGE